MLNLNVTAETPEELKKTLIGLLENLATPGETLYGAGEKPVPDEEKMPTNAEKMPDNAEKMPDNAEKMPDNTENVPANTENVPTMEEARAALNALRQKKGAAAVREILKAHGVSSFTELDPKDYPQVMKEAAVDG